LFKAQSGLGKIAFYVEQWKPLAAGAIVAWRA
jgi:hypothetical protein